MWKRALFLIFLVAGCGESSSQDGEGGSAGQGGSTKTTSSEATTTSTTIVEGCVPPPELQPIELPAACKEGGGPCAADSDCDGGMRCNKALSPPACTQLYCAPKGAPCSNNLHCNQGLTCFGGLCRSCDICGTSECTIDFLDDYDHCGCCNNPVPPNGICSGGVPQCFPGFSLCDGSCKDLDHDKLNCGECGANCGGLNGLSSSPCHVGGSGHVCHTFKQEKLTCNEVCASAGLECDPLGKNVATFNNCCCPDPPDVDIGCSKSPPDKGPSVSCTGGTFSSPFSGVACDCKPKL